MVENERETEALWILFQGDFSDRARCNFISRRRRKCRAARKTRNRKKFDRSIERSVGRSVGHETLPIIVSFIVATNTPHEKEYAYTRKYEVRARDRLDSRKYLTSIEVYRLPSKIPPASDFRKYIFIERAGRRTRTFPRISSKEGGETRIFPRLAVYQRVARY